MRRFGPMLSSFLLILVSPSILCFGDEHQTRQFFSQPKLVLNGTELVDRVMSTVRDEVISAGLDSINLPGFAFKAGNYSGAVRNQTVTGLANVNRTGDVVVEATLFTTKFRSAFSVYNVTLDADVSLTTNTLNYSQGHIHADCDNVTASQVYMLSHLTLTLSLDEFELTVGHCNLTVTGLGESAQNGSTLVTGLFNKMKDPVLIIFSSVLKTFINVGLASVRTALLG